MGIHLDQNTKHHFLPFQSCVNLKKCALSDLLLQDCFRATFGASGTHDYCSFCHNVLQRAQAQISSPMRMLSVNPISPQQREGEII